MDRPFALKHKNLLLAALGDLTRRPVRSLVVILCLTAMLFPVVTGLAVSEGLRFQAAISLEEGADDYVSEDHYGNNGSLSLGLVQRLATLDGVKRVTPRVLGRTYFVDKLVAVVALPGDSLTELRPLVQGDLPRSGGEVLVGHGIAKEFDVKTGLRFTLAANNRKVFKTVGVLRPSCLWGADLLIMDVDDANEFFRVKGRATQLLVWRASDAVPSGSGALRQISSSEGIGGPGFLQESRKNHRGKLELAYGPGSGIFSVLIIVGAALAVPAFLITTGTGFTELRREIGLMKAVGWRTRDVLEKVALENLTVSLIAVCLSVLVSMLWIKGLNGVLIGQFYVAEVGLVPMVDIPSRTLPSHVLFCLLLALGVTQVGGLVSVCTKLILPPGESMR